MYKSQQQRKFMYAKKPGLAKEFEAKTPTGKKLPKVSLKDSMARRLNK